MSTLSLRSSIIIGTVWNFGQSNGVSESAVKISKSLENIRNDVKNENVSFGLSVKEALFELNEVAIDTRIDNWDGYGAKKISKGSYLSAKKFLESLPANLEMPEISVHPDGEVSFDWYKKKGFMLSISISEDDEIAFAYRFGLSKNYGKEYYGDVIPKAILEKITQFSTK